MASEHRLTIPGEIEHVPGACTWVVEVAERAGLDRRDVNHCELAVDEAVTNIIEHGYQSGDAKQVIDLVVREDKNRFSITIIDDGPRFNPLEATNPNPVAKLDERPDYGGGWGVFFIKKVMDEVDYRYVSQRNHLIMTKFMR